MFTLLAFALLAAASIQLDRMPDGSTAIRIVGGAGGTVSVYVSGQSDSSLPPLLGTVTKSGNDLVFTPRFPLQPGREYRVVFDRVVSDYRQKDVQLIRMPNAALRAVTEATHIYPSADVLPANQLKLYVQFSAPMSRGEAYRHIHLLDDSGRRIESAFLELGEELWDSSQTRFTLLFDPGRIKRDLVPNISDGAPLLPSHRYTLRIDPNWRDSEGNGLRAPREKHFSVGAADRASPDPQTWVLVSPSAGTLAPFAVNFPESMDYGLLSRSLSVEDRSGARVSGSVAVDKSETRWLFTPSQPWAAGDYRLSIDGSLEDLAGNRIGRLFEVDTRAASHAGDVAVPKTVALPFSIARERNE